MTSPSSERHVLVIEHPDYEQAVHLEAVAYSIGRDASNAIVLDVDTLSRQHAILLRVPDPANHSYSYRLVDGNAAGKASANGIFVNGQRCAIHALSNGDQISFGRKVRAHYRRLKMAETEFAEYLKSIEYQSLKAKQVDAKATLVTDEVMTGGTPKLPRQLVTASFGGQGLLGDDELTVISQNLASQDLGFSPPEDATLPGQLSARNRSVLSDTVHEPESKKLPLLWMGVIAAILCVGAAGLFWMGRAGQAPQLQPQPSSQQAAPLD